MEETVQLRPRGIGELLDQAVRLYRRNFFTFIAIIAIVQIPTTLISVLISQFTLNNFKTSGASEIEILSQMGSNVGGNILVVIIASILQGIATAALTRAIADNYLGEQTGFMDAYRKIGKDWPRVLLALLLGFLINILLVVWWIFIPCVGWISGIGMLIVFSIVTQFTPIIIVLEHKNALDAIRRGWDLFRRRFWNVIGFYFLLALFAQIITVAPATLASYLLGLAATTLDSTLTQILIQTGITLIMTLLYLPLQLAAMTLLYFDLRVRTEGFDLALLTEQTLSEEMSAEGVTAQAPVAEHGSLITQSEMGNMVLLSLGAYGVILAIWGVLIAISMLFAGLLSLG